MVEHKPQWGEKGIPDQRKREKTVKKKKCDKLVQQKLHNNGGKDAREHYKKAVDDTLVREHR